MARFKGSRLIAQLVQRRFASTSSDLSAGIVYKNVPRHFLEGVQIYSTGHKARYDAHTFISPLWDSNLNTPKLNYGRRLNNGRALVGDEASIGQAIIDEIVNDPRIVARLEGAECSVDFFLNSCFKNYDLFDIQHVGILFDYGIALVLEERLIEAINCLVSVRDRFCPLSQSETFLDACAIIESIHQKDSNHIRLIEKLEARGRSRLGLPM